MVQIAELTKDRSFRNRLILACISVALFVSVTYVVVSYRLTSELGVKTELNAMNLQARIIHNELASSGKSLDERAMELARILFAENQDLAVFVRVTGHDASWEYANKIPFSSVPELLNAISQQPQDSQGQVTTATGDFLWHDYQGQQYRVQLVQSNTALERTMSMVAKRLSIVSLIVFWIAIWLALTLSSFIAKRVQQKNDALAKIATHDTLTGLPNRLFLLDLLKRELGEAGDKPGPDTARQETEGCLFVIDLDKFKVVNDSFGHTAGDTLLVEVGRRLKSLLADSQVLVRMGGDEFIVWASGMQIDTAKALAEKMVEICNAPVMINHLAVQTGASIGIAHYPTHAGSGEMLIVSADTAMYKAKQQHSGAVIFDEPDSEKYKASLRLRTELAQALEREEFRLYYQPKVALATGEITGVEALSRWHHPTEGILPPGAFIGLIEDSGRIQEFGRYVIRHSIRQLAEWQKSGIHVPIAINLSPYNLLDPGLIDFISEQLNENGVEAQQLEIELTENETSLNINSIQQRLESLKQLGVLLAIDDFGTGMSSLAYIAELDVDIIKIDRTFIFDMHENHKHQAIVATALTLSKSFRSKVVAEGIENSEQAAMLVEMGCDYGQGYLYAKPVPSEQMTDMLRENPCLQLA